MTQDKRFSNLKLLKEIAEKLNEGTELENVLNEVLSMLLEVTGFETGWIFLINNNGNQKLAAHKNLPPSLTRENFLAMCKGDCWCVGKYNNGRLEKATNIMECKRLEDSILHGWLETGGLTHHATVPLRAGEERFGLLNVAAPDKTRFNNEELHLLESVAFQIGTAIKRIKLNKLEQETVLAAERNRLARDLHDSVNQLLFSLSLTARAGKEMSSEQNIKDTFGSIQSIAQTALTEMKALIWQLRPMGLENGIVSALKSYGNMIGLTVQSDIKGLITLPANIEEAIWRIGQEAFNNCKKHSGQNSINLHINAEENAVKITINDQGRGFRLSSPEELFSLGLKSMRERTEALNGTFHIESSLETGTSIFIEIPNPRR